MRSNKPVPNSPQNPVDAPDVGVFNDYKPIVGAYDEMFDPDTKARPGVESVVGMIDAVGRTAFAGRKRLADSTLLKSGVTFTVYGDKRSTERVFPFDPVPRVINAAEWSTIEKGLKQRVRALNLFLADIYGSQRIIKEEVIPAKVVTSSSGYLAQMVGIRPPGGVYVQIAGVDLIRDGEGQFLVLEDNLRCPSGVSYVLENRAVMKRVLPGVFSRANVRSVDAYPTRLLETLQACAPTRKDNARIVVLTPGPYNSAYFEHSVLARRMGCDLVVASDLCVLDDRVFVKTTKGPLPVDVIYRRVDDEFMDPLVFREDSMLGIPGIVGAYAKGNVTLANAIGNGVADDKAIYPFVPDMIRFYLDETPLIDQVPTLSCAREKDCAEVIAHPERFVIKSVDASGGYGMVMGPSASKKELAAIVVKIRELPRSYIAQPLIELSTCPTFVGNTAVPRRVDLRPYVLTGEDTWVLPGGLTRVALTQGSYVVNSSQGGGSKDTWIVGGEP